MFSNLLSEERVWDEFNQVVDGVDAGVHWFKPLDLLSDWQRVCWERIHEILVVSHVVNKSLAAMNHYRWLILITFKLFYQDLCPPMSDVWTWCFNLCWLVDVHNIILITLLETLILSLLDCSNFTATWWGLAVAGKNVSWPQCTAGHQCKNILLKNTQTWLFSHHNLNKDVSPPLD